MSGLLQLLNSTGLPQDIVIKATFYPIAFITLFFAILAACMASAWFSVGKIRSLDPVSVFKA
mgnify:CR=1 FL=1